jgi:hypothetical protein
MADSWDEGLRGGAIDEPPLFGSTRPSRGKGPLIAVVVLAIAAAGGVWFAFFRNPADSATSATTPAAAATAAAAQPLGGAAETIDLPPLDDTDPVIRKLVSELSSHPRIAAWLATDGLVRNFTTVVLNIAEGSTPANHLKVLKPATGFEVRDIGEDLEIDPQSYRRYDALADAVGSLDPAGTARLYTMVKPRLEDAHRELGFPDTSFDSTLEKAIVSLLAVPRPSGALRVAPKGIGYRYEDQRLESLTGAQKQLLRMGPRNVKIVQDKLRAIARELGIPDDRLPRS